MSTAQGWKPTLRYSPVNKIIIDWGVNGEPFSMCCLPAPVCPGPAPVPQTPDCQGGDPIVELVDTTDWYRWVPEIIVGFDDASEDMAATYARRAAIEFSRKTRVLKRQVAIHLQPGVTRYPLHPFTDERAEGVLQIESAQGHCACESCTSHTLVNVGDVRVDRAKQELVFYPSHGCCGRHFHARGPEHLLVTLWVAPTEDSCRHDEFLYEQYRSEVTIGARAAFIGEAHSMGSYKTTRGYANFRGDSMMFQRADKMRTQFETAMRKTKVDAAIGEAHAIEKGSPFQGSCCNTQGRRR